MLRNISRFRPVSLPCVRLMSTSSASSDAIYAQIKNKALYQQQCYVDGKFAAPANAGSQELIDVSNPGNGGVAGRVYASGAPVATAAIAAAARAQPGWRAVPLEERCAAMRRWADLMHENKDDLATILSMEQGKPWAEARGEVLYAASFYTFAADNGAKCLADHTVAEATAKAPTTMRVTKEPIGVIAAITPWNFPSAMITRKSAFALAAGCTMVLKPSELTPFSALALGELATQAGIPAGVFNVVVGDAATIGGAMMESKTVRKITFTGSTRVGKILMGQAADSVKRVSLELGGNAPFIVFEDADVDLAVAQATAAKTRNAGQTCVTPNRFLVHSSVYDEFVEKLAASLKTVKVGYGLAEGSQMGPLINEAAVEKVEAQLANAISLGAKVVCGGARADVGTDSKLYFQPTVIAAATPTMDCFTCETFGPLAPVFKFESEAEAIALANNTNAGLASYFFTRDEARQERVAAALEYGMVGVNQGSVSSAAAPFGGMKESGMGREGSVFGFDDFVEIKARHYNKAGQV